MSKDCGCNGKQASSGAGAPSIDPSKTSESNGGSSMSDRKPTLIPPAAGSSTGISGAGASSPSLMPPTKAATAGGLTAWNNDKRVSALWGMNENRNSWVFVPAVGWKKLANNSDSAVVALTILAAHAKQTQTAYTYRDEADGMIHEAYVW